jgi:ubiquinone/menaquinone biosynthesis C-methylase UbiE
MHSYDSTVKIYDARYAEEQEAKYKAALENVKPAGMVLDVGCGTGLFFKHVADEAGCIVGVDSSKKLLLEAQNHARGWRKVHLVQADADHLPFKADFFDVVFAFTLLQNMPKPVETLRELGRVAKPDFQVVVTGLKKVFSSSRLREMLERAGLCPVSIMDDELLKCYVAFSLKSSK